MGALWQDLRYGLRMLAKNPGFTAVAVATLALGIGANTAMFSVVNAILLRPLPYQNPGRLAVLWTDNLKQNLHQERTSYPNFEDWRKHSRAFQDMAFSSAFTVNLTGGDEPERVIAGRASANLFPVMGVKPILGRAFSSEEEERGERVVLLSYGLWQRRFGSSQDVLGKSLEIDGAPAVIVGVMPATFEIPARNTQLWEPLTLFPNWNTLKRQRNTPSGFVVGRLRPGFTFAQAQSDTWTRWGACWPGNIPRSPPASTFSVSASKRRSSPICRQPPNFEGNSFSGRRETLASPARSQTLTMPPPSNSAISRSQKRIESLSFVILKRFRQDSQDGLKSGSFCKSCLL